MTPEQSAYIRKLIQRVEVLEASVSMQGQQILALHEQLKKRQPTTRFSPPTLDEVTAQIRHKGYLIDPETFWHYHNARGWVLTNGKPMRCWKSALVTFSKHTEFSPPETLRQQHVDRQALARKRQREEQRRQFEQDNANAIRPRIRKP